MGDVVFGFVRHCGGKATKIVFYGSSIDVDFAAEIFDEVCYFITAAAQLRFGNALARGEAAAYAEGFACALYKANKVQADRQLESSKTDSHALVVVNRGLALGEGADAWLEKEQGVKLSKGRSGKSAAGNSWDAYSQGKEDGKSYKPSSSKKSGYLS